MKKDKSIFAEALAESVIPEILNESLPLDYEHEFSDEFERRMSKIIKRRKKMFYLLSLILMPMLEKKS